MNPNVLATGLAVALAGCGPKVLSNPKADPDVTFYRGDGPVAVGSALAVMVTWDGWCEQPSIGVEGGGGAGAAPCHPVAHSVSFRCDDDACRWQATGDSGFVLILTKPGTVHPYAIVTPRGGGGPRTYPMEPVEVVVPDAATMACARMGDDVDVTVRLTHQGRTVLAGSPSLRLDGAACTSTGAPLLPGQVPVAMESQDYLCDGAPADAHAELSTESYHVAVSAHCAPSPGAAD